MPVGPVRPRSGATPGRGLVAKAFAALYPRANRQRITHALELAAPQTCDEEAERVVSD